jgi:rhodanese-related sulfurtransferase
MALLAAIGLALLLRDWIDPAALEAWVAGAIVYTDRGYAGREALESRLDELVTDLGRLIALACRTDRRSAKAATLLARRGIANLHVVQGGMTAWLGNDWAVEDATPKPE